MSIKINLLRGKVKNNKFNFLLAVFFLVAIAALGLWHVVIVQDIRLVKEQHDVLEQEQGLIVKDIEDSEQKNKDTVMLQKKSNVVKELRKKQLFVANFFNSLNKNIVDRVCLVRLTIEGCKVSMEGQARGVSDIEMFMKKISTDWNAVIKIQKISRQNDLYDFSVILLGEG